MPSASLRHCPSCGRLRRGETCAACGWASRRVRVNRRPARPDLRRREWVVRSAAILAAHRADHGEWCPGWSPSGHEPHPTSDLTVHHHTDDPDGPCSVLCRRENGRLGKPGAAP